MKPSKQQRVGTFLCWLWGHKFVYWLHEGPGQFDETPHTIDCCVRCGAKRVDLFREAIAEAEKSAMLRQHAYDIRAKQQPIESFCEELKKEQWDDENGSVAVVSVSAIDTLKTKYLKSDSK